MKLRRRSKEMLSKRLDTIRNSVAVYQLDVDGTIVVHLKKSRGIGELKQCILFTHNEGWYNGVRINELDKEKLTLEELPTWQQAHLLRELT